MEESVRAERAKVTPITPGAALGICAALLLAFGAISFLAASKKSATYDEVVHAPAGYTYLRYFDFRANPEHPPLWKYWAALPWLINGPATVHVDGPEWRSIPDDLTNQWAWGTRVLYRTPGNDADALLARQRFMMMLLGVACGGMLAWWAYRLAGPVAAVVTCAAYSLDPNFLAHTSLVTNDVAFCLAAVALAYFLWRAGQRLTWPRGLAVAVLCGVCITTKFTGVMAIPVIGAVLVARALLPGDWPVLGWELKSRPGRLGAAIGLCAATGVVTFGWIWLAYGLRGQTAPDPEIHANMDQMVAESAVNEIMGRTGKPATAAEIRGSRPSLYVDTLVRVLQRHLLPDAFLNGLWFAYSKSLFRYAYLMGDVYGTGRWYYFPVAVAVKTPLATLAGLVGAAAVAIAASRRWRGSRDWVWAAVCLAVPAAVFGMAAMRSHMNIGIRHFFPVYVFAFVAAGVVVARLWERRPGLPKAITAVVALALAVESLAAFPNFIPFFNAAAGGTRGGVRLLGDSNLDWGQDLPLVAEWQRRNPNRLLRLAYFGTADPAYYGIRAQRLIGGYGLEVPDRPIPTTGVIAVSATTLQGIWLAPGQRNPYAHLLTREPTEVLGGSIYLYDLGGP
jgi:hypothetical protein